MGSGWDGRVEELNRCAVGGRDGMGRDGVGMGWGWGGGLKVELEDLGLGWGLSRAVSVY